EGLPGVEERAGRRGADRLRLPDRGTPMRRFVEAHRLAAPFVVERITSTDAANDLSAVEEIARACFSDAGFSVKEELERPWSRLWVARPERERRPSAPVGFLVAWHVADELHVLNIATDPPMRRRGIARKLMDEALLYAKGTHIRIIILEVRRSNRA